MARTEVEIDGISSSEIDLLDQSKGSPGELICPITMELEQIRVNARKNLKRKFIRNYVLDNRVRLESSVFIIKGCLSFERASACIPLDSDASYN